MKKIILILLLFFSINVYSQIDTSVWSLTRNSSDGKYSLITNKLSFGGVGAGTITVPLILTIADIDTSKYSLLRNNIDGKYSTAINKTSLYGIDSGMIKVSISYLLNPPTAQSLGIDTSKILDPADFAGGKFIQEYNGSFVPVSKSDLIGYKELVLDVLINDGDSLITIAVISNTTGTPNNSIIGTFIAETGFSLSWTAITGNYYVLFNSQYYYSNNLFAVGGFLSDDGYTGTKTTNPNGITITVYNTTYTISTNNILGSHIPLTIRFYP